MLIELLAIKRRRERGIRTSLANLADRLQSLQQKQRQLTARRETLLAEWRALAQQEGCMNKTALNRLRAALSTLETEVQRLDHEHNELVTEQGQLTQLHAEQEKQLHLNLREQEKLKLLEHEQ
ncbi:type III secretion protein [Aeromonas jandaei]|uniref:type III secretion protein n=1 Tax=Aeromonas jandaei TaxID=650 RepID=UPI003B9DFB39